jgi:hypothetical protein
MVRIWIVDVPALIQIGADRALMPLSNTERENFFLPTRVPAQQLGTPTVTPQPAD